MSGPNTKTTGNEWTSWGTWGSLHAIVVCKLTIPGAVGHVVFQRETKSS